MRNLKRVTAAVLVAIIGLAGCAREELVSGDTNGTLNGGGAGKSELKTVTLKIVSGSPATRAEGSSVTGTVNFDSGHLLFVSDQNNITKVMTIISNSSDLSDTQVGINLLTSGSGATITDVPGHSSSVYAVGNLPGNIIAPAVGESLTALKAKLVEYSSQHDIAKVTLFGGDDALEEIEAGKKYKASFKLAPLVARIEIKKIQSASGSDIKAFNVDGIFINNYYEQIQLDGYAPANTVRNHADIDDFILGSSAYPAAEKGYLFDYKDDAKEFSLGTSSDGGHSYVPSAGNAWAYNLLAPDSFAVTPAATPHIVIRLSGIHTTNNVNYNDVWYLTVSGLKVKGASAEIDKLVPGKVYSIEKIVFSQSNIQPAPEMKPIEVTVEVSIVDWTSEETDVVFGQK